jgi:muconolactone delta-isomerase
MKILAIEKELPGRVPQDFEPHLRAEAKKIWELYQAGAIRELYFRQDRSEAVLVLECDNTDEAGMILSKLPLVQHKLITFEVIPLIPYPGISRLFVPEQGSTNHPREADHEN